MSTEVLDDYAPGTSEADFQVPDDDDLDEGPVTEPEAPYGWIVVDGVRRPKKKPGRPRNQPSADELAAAPPVEREPDRVPQRPPGHVPKLVADVADEPKMPRAGVIAGAVNMLYRRAGKMVRGLESGDLDGAGQAMIEMTRPDEDGNLTVGEAWENLAKVNPRVRALLLKAVAGGAYADLVMAHAPIGIALVMKPWVQKIIRPDKVMAIAASMAEPDDDEPEGTALPGGLTEGDLKEMSGLIGDQAEEMARRMARGAGVKITSADIAEVRRRAEAEAGGQPPGRRQQPKNRTRAQRTRSR
jgi:hypothetical protein